MSREIKIIENSKEARDEHGHRYGSSDFEISGKHIQALMLGKCLAIEINMEYVVFITLE